MSEATRETWSQWLMSEEPSSRRQAVAGNFYRGFVSVVSNPAALAGLTTRTSAQKWRPIKGREGFGGWTDDFASILPVIKWTKH